MNKSFAALIFLLSTTQAFSFPTTRLSLDEKVDIAKNRCTPQTKDEPILYRSTFKGFNRSLDYIDQLYTTVYKSEERFLNRVGYFEEKGFISKDITGDSNDQVVFPEHIIKAVILHIENALKLNYAKYIFFPDMGHSHLFIPLNYYTDVIENNPNKRFHAALQLAFHAPKLKTLYHTAEQLKMLDDEKNVLPDRYLQWRFYTRNPVADLQGNIEIHTDYNQKGGHNTVRHLDGHRFFAGFNLSANKNGCFPFQDKSGAVQYFDLSAWDLPYNGNADDSYSLIKKNQKD